LPEVEPWTYIPQRILGKGSFGTVYQCQVQETGAIVAIKSIRMATNGEGCWKQLTGEREREVQILKELDGHPNIVCLKAAFLTHDKETPAEAKLNLVLEFLSDTLHRVLKHYNQMHKTMDHYYVKLYLFQLMRGLAFIHGRGIVHCDIKPQNLLLDGKTQTLKICDFGTAKRLVTGKALTSYVCSRYYRAPEIILGATLYSTSVDLWSAGCVFAEMLLGQPLFTGTDGINQLVEIIKVLGTPSPQELQAMNPNYPVYEFTPKITPHPWEKVFRGWTPREANELTELLLRYDPATRLPPLYVLMHRFFDELRKEDRSEHRRLFNFRPDELWWAASRDRERLIPKWSSTRVKVEKV
jgi:serine/threonine protein kinase